MIRIGDKVKFLNEVGGGTVVKLINKNMVSVENQDGFEIPTLISELVVVEPIQNSLEQPAANKDIPQATHNQVVTDESTLIKGKDEPSFFICFMPENESNPIDGVINCYFINDCNFKVLLSYFNHAEEEFELINSGIVPPNSTFFLEAIAGMELDNHHEKTIQFIATQPNMKELCEPVTKPIKINPVKFYKDSSYVRNEFFEKKAILIPVIETKLQKDIKQLKDKFSEKDVVSKTNVSKERKNTDLIEIDLHINELIDSTEGLSNREILEIQMQCFRNEMESSISSKAKKIVFIHGVGQGILKNEIYKELRSRYKKYYFQDASFKEYGYGATMVTINKG